MEKDYIERSKRTREDHGRDRPTSKEQGEVEVQSVGPTRHIGVKDDDEDETYCMCVYLSQWEVL